MLVKRHRMEEELEYIYLVHSPVDNTSGETLVPFVEKILKSGGVGANRAWIDQVVGTVLFSKPGSGLRSLPEFENWKRVFQRWWCDGRGCNVIYSSRRAILQSMRDPGKTYTDSWSTAQDRRKTYKRVNFFYWSEDIEHCKTHASEGSRIVYRVPKGEALARGVLTHDGLKIYKTPWVVPMSYLVNEVPPHEDNDRLLREWYGMLDTDFGGVSVELIECSRAMIEGIKAPDASSSVADDLSAFGFRF